MASGVKAPDPKETDAGMLGAPPPDPEADKRAAEKLAKMAPELRERLSSDGSDLSFD
jgi:hypothetical protein